MSDLHTTSSSSAPPRKRPGAVFGMGGPGAMMKGEKARNFKGTMKKLLAYLNKFKAPIIVVMLFAAGSTVFSILDPNPGKRDNQTLRGCYGRDRGKSGGVDFTAIGTILLSTLGLYLLSALFSYIQAG